MTGHPGEDSLPDKSPTACRRGCCTSIDCCVCPSTPPVPNCQGLGGTVRRSAAASALTRRLSPVVRGQGVSFAYRLLHLPWHAARYQLSGVRWLVWHVDTIASPVIRGDS
ncbi:hypothetical protein B296_00016245 [Ensete ventricosum]|uniref:Uncharacterized protein n=1 Tax=Ensete ventricosum TaxID=4639 RepID=A0A426ZD39_ENSVE|nr:hypothetical protein B296_00016245 [Ensete ventricosum]